MNIKNIKVVKKWYWNDVRELCIRQNWYDKGTCGEYDTMLEFVKNSVPSTASIYQTAKDILEHTSDEQTLSNIMFYLANDVVKIFYEIEDE